MGIHGGHRKKTRHARSRDRWHRGPRSRPDRLGTDSRHCKDRAGVEGKFLAMDERHPGVRFEWQVGYFACSVSRSQVPTVRAVHCKAERAPSKDRLCYRVCVAVEEAWIRIAGLICAAGVYAVPDGTRNLSTISLSPALPCRATGCSVPTGLGQPGWTSGHSSAGLWQYKRRFLSRLCFALPSARDSLLSVPRVVGRCHLRCLCL